MLSPAARWAMGGVAAGLLVLLAVLSVLVAGRPPGHWELEVVRTATDAPDVVGYPARAVMQMGTFPAIVTVALGAAWSTRKRLPPVAVLLAGIVGWGVANRMKVLVDRDRPLGVRLREAQDGLGYPSGHSSVAFAVATVVAALLPARWRWAPFLAAAVVAGARMHVGVHYPLDVVGGAVLGVAVGLAVVAALDPARR